MDAATKKRKVEELHGLMEAAAALKRDEMLAFFEPVEKQKEFYDAGATFRQRMFMASNQSGKTLGMGVELAYHLTGEYPDWWEGKRWNRPIVAWAGGVTAVSTRDNPQRILLGRKREYGTGTVPKRCIVGTPTLARGETDAVDSFMVQHKSGGISICYFKNYAQGREKWQGETLDLVWMDEEPPYDIFEEALTRLNRKRGLMCITFTPLMGMTEVVRMFYDPDPDDPGTAHRKLIQMTLEDATFYTKEEMELIRSQYPVHAQRARVKGLPTVGEGLVFPFSETDIMVEPFPIPRHFRRIVGMDFGVNHPTAAVWLAYDADADTIYVTDCYKQQEDNYAVHADAINSRGDWIPVAWPHDGLKTEMGSGKSLADLYRQKHVKMLAMSARYKNETGGRQTVEPVVDAIYNRMATGRFKVFSTQREWFREQAMYHRKDGKIVPYNDDLMAATRYAVMMLRFAATRSEVQSLPKSSYDETFDPLDI